MAVKNWSKIEKDDLNRHQYLIHPSKTFHNKKAQLSLTNPRDACEKFARFT